MKVVALAEREHAELLVLPDTGSINIAALAARAESFPSISVPSTTEGQSPATNGPRGAGSAVASSRLPQTTTRTPGAGTNRSPAG